MDIYNPYITDSAQLKFLYDNTTGQMQHTLMNDFLSKYSFQKDLFALRGLLSALLSIPTTEITDIKVLNPIEPGNNMTEKECILDIKLELNHIKIINIEIQARYQDFWPERSITYLCRNFDNLKNGESYNLVKPCIQIGILFNDLFKKDDPRYTGEFYSEYRLLNTSTHTEYSSKFEIRVLSLSQLENATDEEKNNPNGLYHWARLFKASSWEELKMIAQNNPEMTSFVGTVMQLSAEEKVAQACEARRRWSNDIATYEEEIESGKAALADVKGKLADVKGRLANTKGQLADAKTQLANAQNQLTDTTEQLSNTKDQLADTTEQLSNAKDQLADTTEQLSNTKDQLADTTEQLSNTKDQLADTTEQLSDAKKEIENLKKQLESLKSNN